MMSEASPTINDRSKSERDKSLPSPIQRLLPPTLMEQKVPQFPVSPSFRSQPSSASLLLEQALFTSYNSNGSVFPDEDEGSLPSLPIEGALSVSLGGVPPSPVSRPPPSLLEEEDAPDFVTAASVHQQPVKEQTPLQSHQCEGKNGKTMQQDDQNPGAPVSPGSQDVRNRQPPVPEVLLNNEEDTFFEDRSLEQRAHRSLIATLEAKSNRQSPAPTSEIASEPFERKQVQPVDSSREQDVSYFSGPSLHALIRMKEELVRGNEKLKTMEQGNRILVGERNSLKRQLNEQEIMSNRQLMEFKVEVSRLSGVAETMQAQKDEWMNEKSRLEERIRGAAREKKDLMHKRLASENRQKELKLQLERLQGQFNDSISEKSALKEENSRLREDVTALEKSKLELEERMAARANDEEHRVKAQTENVREEWKKEQETQRRNLESLRRELEESRRHWEQEKSSLQQEKERLETECLNAAEQLGRANESSRHEIEKLQRTVKESNETIAHLLASKSSLRLAGSSTRYSVRFQREGVPTDIETVDSDSVNPAFSTSSIAERLARIRDSTERANLIRTHNRELERLKQEKEMMEKKLDASHAEALRRARKHADVKMETRIHEVKTNFRHEYDEKLEEVESRHRQETAEVRCCVLIVLTLARRGAILVRPNELDWFLM